MFCACSFDIFQCFVMATLAKHSYLFIYDEIVQEYTEEYKEK